MSRYIAGLQATRFLLGALTAYGCGGSDLVLPSDSDVGPPAAISMVKGDDQTGAPGTLLPDSIVVRVTDSAGTPVPNQQVVFTLASAAQGAAVTPQSAMTGPDGRAGARWILGQATGPQEVIAQVIGQSLAANLEVRFTAAATVPPAVDRLVLRTQPSGSVKAGEELERQPMVQIRDAEGDDVERSGVLVTAAVAAGAGTLAGTTTRATDSNGRAAFTDLQINGATGVHVLIFAADGYTSITSEPIDVSPADAPPPPGDNQSPVATDDEYNSIEGYEKTLIVGAAGGVLQNDRDPEGGPLTAKNASDPPHGRVTLRNDGSFTYNPEPSFFGDDRFTYRVEDAEGKSSSATVTIHVAPLNDRPRFIHRGNVTVSASSGPRRIEKWARSISPGADNESDQILTFDVSNDNAGLFTSGGQPAVTRDGPQSKTGTLTFTPSGRTGTATVTVVLRDNGGDNLETSQPATFKITVQ